MNKSTSPQKDDTGAALVIILAFAVLLTGLVVAFLSRAVTERQVSNSSASQTKADILAHSALDVVVADFKQEIVNSSTAVYPSPSPASGTVYMPKSTLYMRPMKDAAVAALTGSNIIPNLLRVSGTFPATLPMVTTGSASNTVSTGTSANGRSINPSRWNSHYLIPRKNAGQTPIDSTPIDSFANSVTPAWVMVTNQGPVVLTSPTNAVIGRYSYAVYDESMLLDANVAGYPSSSGTAQIGKKTSLAYADLTQIGIGNPNTLTTTGTAYQVDNIVGWRNYTEVQPPNSQTLSGNYDFHALPASGTKYDTYLTSATNGFLATSGGTFNGRTDQMFTSRQSLLKFRRATGFSQDALQYLGTFSRSITAPSWGPTTPVPSASGTSAIDYAAIADSGTSFNRNLVNVRFQVSGTVTHYNDDGTQVKYGVTAGDALVQRRFSLAKLAWVGHLGPDSTKFSPTLTTAQQAQAVLDCFGLQYDSTHRCWNYNHTDTAHPRDPNDILTMDQISKLTTPRESDMFELLKAGILQGSLGGDPGTGQVVTSGTEGVAGMDFDLYSKDTDRHIFQIGANMVDQADSDNYPTAIYNNAYTKYAEDNLYNCVFGDENLPLLTRMGLITVYMPDHYTGAPTPVPDPGTEAAWMQPEIWNPHEMTTADPTKYPNTPSYLRLVTYGSVSVEVVNGSLDKHTGTTTVFSGVDVDHPNANGIICFKNPVPTSTTPTSFFATPVNLTGLQGTTSAQYDYFDSVDATLSGTANRVPPDKTSIWAGPLHPYTYFLGVWLGIAGERDPANYPQHGFNVYPQQATGGYLTFALQYKDSDGVTWLPYCVIARVTDIDGNGFSSGSKYGSLGWQQNFGHPDPRTDRFSASFSGIRAGNNPAWQGTSTIREAICAGNAVELNGTAGRGMLFDMVPRTSAGFVHGNKSSYYFDAWSRNLTSTADGFPANNFYYSDPDKITRPGDAGWPDTVNTTQQKTFTDATYNGEGDMLLHSTNVPVSATRRRPVILNRPFQSVGELGYVFRDLPFKTLDFRTNLSADAGLLDLFTTADQPVLVAGQISPNATAPVIQAVVSGAMKQDATLSPATAAVVFSGTESSLVGTAIMAEVSGTGGPLGNRADLVNRLAVPTYNALTGSGTSPYTFFNKTYGETAVRALAPVTNTRTWNLMIDVIAQSGHLTPNAKKLDDFVVEGEKRYWLHVAIDRYTGKVVDQQLEPVYE